MIKDLENEVWKIHPKYTDYAASNYGRIKHLERDTVYKNGAVRHYDEQLIKPYLVKKGYLKFKISKDNKIIASPYAHRFVYECFHQMIIPDNLEVNHLSEKKDENFIENLSLTTPKQNCNWGTRNERISESLTNRKDLSKQVGQYDLEGNLIKMWESTQECGRNGFNFGHISACCRGEETTHKGFIWKYI